MTREFQTSYKKNGFRYQYYFILGNTPILSSAELASVFARDGIAVEWLSVSDEVVVLEMVAPIDPSALITTLGGVVKIGRMLSPDMTTDAWVRSRKHDGRLVVGVSVYKAAVGISNTKCAETLRTVRGEILDCKRALKEEGRALRLVTGRDRAMPSVALVTEHMLERGGELVVLLSNNGETQFGETLAVQAFHQYRVRDMGRPSRDAVRGMLPQKVAQMMINLAGVKDGGIISDPFCGSGTVLQEAALLGYQVVGSDIAEAAVEDTKKNFQFLSTTYAAYRWHPANGGGNLQLTPYNFFVADVRSIADHLEKQSVDAIVTEPYLGPPLTGRENPEQLAKIRHDVTALVTDAFKAFDAVLRPHGRVVIVLPVLGGVLLPIEKIEKLGWSLHTEGFPRMGGRYLTSRGTILYSRADQHLAREISVWTRG